MMKKLFLSAVIAMGSVVATATTPEDGASIDLGTTAYTSSDDMWTTTDFTVSLTLDVNKLKDALRTSGVSKTNYNFCTFTLRNSTSDTAHVEGTKVIFATSSSSNTTSSVWTTANGTTGWSNLGGTDVFLSEYVDNQWSNATGASLTMACSKSTGAYTLLTVYLSDGTFLDYVSNDSALKWSDTAGVSSIEIGDGSGLVTDAYLFDSKLDAASIQSINRSLIPEPATATLSLLALAGFAARRRRR